MRKQDDWAYLYCVSNEAIPGKFMIGRTKKPPLERIKEHDSQSSVPLPFTLEFVSKVKMKDYKALENGLKATWAYQRIGRKEWFEGDPAQCEFLYERFHATDDFDSFNQELKEERNGGLKPADKRALEKEEKKRARRPNSDFEAMGLKVGDRLYPIDPVCEPVEIVDTKRVKDEDGEVGFLSPMTKLLQGLENITTPLMYWKDEKGVLLKTLYENWQDDSASH